ncbi:hypothetical protein [Variovorax paradoxus]|nr:hypothetical protein [Variovorax paradoxus]MDP9928050.1 hypothetical protein [Variovorax paradoxus]
MNGIQIESIKSASGASVTCEEINEIFFSQGVLRRSGKATAPARLAA